jgi:hypothetical protein
MSTTAVPKLPALSDVLSLAPIDENVMAQLHRAEAIAPSVLAKHGLLLDFNVVDEVDLYDVVNGILAKDELRKGNRITDALSALRLTIDGDGREEEAGALAAEAYTPKIDAAYFLGLAMGFAAAQKIGGAR